MSSLVQIVVLCLISFANSQTECSEKLDSCNVVCNCDRGVPFERTPHQDAATQGPPGKKGAKGEIGGVGEKGEKGDTGSKGPKGNDADEALISSIMGAISATSCHDLQAQYRISVTGYYPMMVDGVSSPVYQYCDFKGYPESRNCDELFQRRGINQPGYYLFGSNVATSQFQFCKPMFTGVYTCQALLEKYPQVLGHSGFYKLKTEGMQPFRVFCNFNRTPAVTEVYHDLMTVDTAMRSCEPSGCFVAAPTYDVTSKADLINIIDSSISCRQYIKLKCQGVLIVRDRRSWWVSRNGEKMSYWGGTSKSNNCACGETNSCIDNTYSCNCDQNSESLVASDEGYLTDKTKLPVKELRIGDMGGTNELAWYTIGKLECSGQV